MSQERARAVAVTDRAGLRGLVETRNLSRSENGQVLVHLENGQQALVPVDALLMQEDGSFRLPFSFAELARGQEARGRREAAGAREELTQVRGGGEPSRRGGAADERVVVPVVAEQLDVQKRRVESGGVRIRKVVREREEVVDEPLVREEVQVRRVPVNRVVDGPVPVRHVGDTMIISLLEEVLVVEKRLMLKEELHVAKTEVETYKPQRVTLRSEEAIVERADEAGRPGPRPFDDDDEEDDGRPPRRV